MRIALRRVDDAGVLEEERDRVDAEAADADLEPEPDDARDLLAHGRVRDVEVGLVGEEPVQVVLPRLAVVGPHALLLAGEDHVDLDVRLLVDPHVPVPVGRVRIGSRRLEPRMLVGRVVDHEVDDHLDAAVAGGADRLDELAVRAEPRVDAVEVGDVVAVVAVRCGEERHEPDDAHADPGEVVDPFGEAGEVAHAVAVPVEERLDIQAVDDGALPPLVARRRGCSRASSGRTLAP